MTRLSGGYSMVDEDDKAHILRARLNNNLGIIDKKKRPIESGSGTWITDKTIISLL